MTTRHVCPRCSHFTDVVHVHGHGQCTACGENIEPCCGGSSAADEAGAVDDLEAGVEPSLFPKLFDQLGGRDATVTTDALLFALVQHLGGDLDEALLVVEAGERVGVLERAGESLHRLRTRS